MNKSAAARHLGKAKTKACQNNAKLGSWLTGKKRKKSVRQPEVENQPMMRIVVRTKPVKQKTLRVFVRTRPVEKWHTATGSS
jgi:hypothetical protein